jgi:DNA topoisomerase I
MVTKRDTPSKTSSGKAMANTGAPHAGKHLVIVESPAKAETINKYLGNNYKVLASYGHVRDLAAKNGSVDPDNEFSMVWELNPKSKARVDELVRIAKDANGIILATDPDREGEAISWHVLNVLQERKAIRPGTPIQRVVFNEITKRAIQDAIEHPRHIDEHLVDAYLARRALDYLVGFTLSPVLWRKLPGSRSAGRVQSVALRIICEREEEIEQFITQEYWSLAAGLQTLPSATPPSAGFSTRLIELDGKKLERLSLANKAMADHAVAQIQQAQQYVVKSVEKKTVHRNPYPPFITSTLQQEAARKLGFSVTRTMQTAQRLYEGISLDGETVGLITYMRTDGTNLAEEAVTELRQYISQQFGPTYLPPAARVYKTKAKNAQEAHEAIRPTSAFRHPDQMKAFLNEDQHRLYELIWKRAVACQMEQMVLDQVTVDITPSQPSAGAVAGVVLRATGSVVRFDGYSRVYREDIDDHGNTGKDDDETRLLPPMVQGQVLTLLSVTPEQHFTKPPPRYSEASLVKKMEELGLGRPSTYASIIRILQERNYVRMDARRFIPEDRGRLVTSFLTQFFGQYVQYNFTAELENKLDDISGNRIDYHNVLKDFWEPFHATVDGTKQLTITDVLNALDEGLAGHFFKVTAENPDPRKCPSCADGRLGLKLGRFGAFIGCSNYPTCKHTRQLTTSEGDDSPESQAMLGNGPVNLGADPETGKAITLHKGPYGMYVQLGEEEELPPEAEGAAAKTTKAKKTTSTTKASTKKPAKPKTIKPKRTSLPKEINPANITLEQAVQLLSLPRSLGNHPDSGEAISTSLGRFGPYIKVGATFVSLKKEDNVLTIDLARAVELFNSSGKKTIPLGEHHKKPVTVQKGRFGYFIGYNKKSFALPKGTDPETVTLEMATQIIDSKLVKDLITDTKPAKAGAKTATKSAAKPARKSTAASKSTTVRRKSTTAS